MIIDTIEIEKWMELGVSNETRIKVVMQKLNDLIEEVDSLKKIIRDELIKKQMDEFIDNS